MKFSKDLMVKTSAAALMVLFGVIVKNSFEQMGMPNHAVGKPVGIALFALGWLGIAYTLSLGKANKSVYVIPSLLILGSVMLMKKYMSKGQSPPMLLPLIFAVSWIALGYAVGSHLSGMYKYAGLIASAFVLLSMMGMLPFQRSNGIVDGPGMPLFVLAWVIIVLMNSARN